jgi:hypothetical protein
MSDLAALVRRYVDRYNLNDVDGMLDCCADDVVFETVSNPGGSIRLTGKDEMREETVFSGVAAAELGQYVRPGEHVSIRGATMFELKDNKLSRICDYS